MDYDYDSYLEDTKVKFDIEISRASLIRKINDYFDIGNSFTYELTRVKTADLTIDDFEEWTEENTENLTDYIIKSMKEILVNKQI